MRSPPVQVPSDPTADHVDSQNASAAWLPLQDPSLLSHGVSVAQMERIDQAALNTLGIPRLLLMEHAGLAVARAARTLLPTPSRPVLVCCGTGFNGGDGFAASRHLHDWGYPLRIAVAGHLNRLQNEASTFAAILQRLGLAMVELTAEASRAPAGTTWPQFQQWLEECGLIIDALLGIGLRGAVREPAASMVTQMNAAGKPMVAVDIPSGLGGDTGLVQGVAVNASLTVTFGRIKQGCLIQQGPAHTGLLTVDSITIPRALLRPTLR